jgi:hypothetical protein
MTKNKSLVKGGLQKIYLNIIKNKKQITVVSFLLLLCLMQIAASSVQAGTLWDTQAGKTEIGTPFGASGGQAGDLKGTIINIIQTLLGFLGLIMTLIIIWSGWRWMTAGGDEKKVETARSHLIQAAIGGVIIIAAYVITFFVIATSYNMITNDILP